MKDYYEGALEAAGATVRAFQSFGSYQGDWWAYVTTPDGRSGWIHGHFGSCSGCDSYQAEIGWDDGHCDEHYTASDQASCVECAEKRIAFQDKVKRFGSHYLETLMTQEEAEKATATTDWNDEAEARAFIETRR
jgi:hypothetical protein